MDDISPFVAFKNMAAVLMVWANMGGNFSSVPMCSKLLDLFR